LDGRHRFSATGVVYAAIIAATVALFVLSIPFGALAIFSPNLSTNGTTASSQIAYVPVYIGLITVGLPFSPSFGLLFVSLTALYALMLAVAAMQGGGLLRALWGSARGEGVAALLRNPLSATIVILGATLLATILLDLLQTSVGVATGGLSGDPYIIFVSLVLAPLIEEVGFRFFLIGVPLFVILLLIRWPTGRALRSLWRPSAAWEGVSAESSQSVALPALRSLVYLLVALSAVVFGLAHFLSGAGWDIGKVSEAALDGVALAYLYVRYGLHASIIFHWAVDFASNAFAFYGQAAYGVSWTANSNYSLLPTLDIVILVGVPGLIYIVNLVFKSVVGRVREVAPPKEPVAAGA
jgi:membrane protease YdiL (CAAX protease family)